MAAGQKEMLLTTEAFTELLALDTAVRGLNVSGRAFGELCTRERGAFWSANLLLDTVQGDAVHIEALRPNLTFPLFCSRVFLGPFVGGGMLACRARAVTLGGGGNKTLAKATMASQAGEGRRAGKGQAGTMAATASPVGEGRGAGRRRAETIAAAAGLSD